jgi:hypothetical protein
MFPTHFLNKLRRFHLAGHVQVYESDAGTERSKREVCIIEIVICQRIELLRLQKYLHHLCSVRMVIDDKGNSAFHIITGRKSRAVLLAGCGRSKRVCTGIGRPNTAVSRWVRLSCNTRKDNGHSLSLNVLLLSTPAITSFTQ